MHDIQKGVQNLLTVTVKTADIQFYGFFVIEGRIAFITVQILLVCFIDFPYAERDGGAAVPFNR